MSHRERRALQLTEAAILTLFGLTLLVNRDLPLVDLPQHAWQLANWLRIDAHDPGVQQLELHFRTPYLLAYPLARLLAECVSVITALKLTLAVSLAAQVLTFRRLCEYLGYDAWLGLLALPLGLGYSFCFGFVAFSAAVPLVYLAFLETARQRVEPSFAGALRLGTVSCLLLVAHGVAFGFTLAVLVPVLLVGAGRAWLRLAPLAGAPLLALVWLAPAGASTRLGGDLFQLEPERALELPAQLVGIGAADHASSLLGALLLGAVVAHLGRARSTLLLYPLAAALLGYLLFPTMFRGAGPLHPRFSSLVVPALLFGFAPRADYNPSGWSLRRVAVVVVSLAVPALFALRLPAFEREMADLHRTLARVPPGLALRPLVFERGSRAFPGIPAFLHVPAYYAASTGGDAGYSFAMYSISVVRFRPGVRVKMGGGSEWTPESFDAEREAADYDYFLARTSFDRTQQLFPAGGPRAELVAHIGAWWLYRRQRELG